MRRMSIIVAGLLAFAVGWPVAAQQAPSGPVTSVPAAEADAFGAQVRAYLLQHPD